MDEDNLRLNGFKVDALYRAVRESQSTKLIPKLVEQIINDGMWKSHLYEKTSETYNFEDFRVFVETHPPDGLGVSLKNLMELCVDDPDVIDLIDQTVEATSIPSKDTKSKKKFVAGNERIRGLRKLRSIAAKDLNAAELREKVHRGEMSLNSALISLGLKKKRYAIATDVNKTVAALKEVYKAEQLDIIVAELQNDKPSDFIE